MIKARARAILAALGLLGLTFATVYLVRHPRPIATDTGQQAPRKLGAFSGTTAKFKINGTAAVPPGFDATTSQVITLQLAANPAPDIYQTKFSIYDPGDPSSPLASLGAPVLTLSPSTGIAATPTSTVTFTMPASGAHTYKVRCVVNGGVQAATGAVVPQWTYERIIAIRATSGVRKQLPGESTEYNARGWSDEQNREVDALGATVTPTSIGAPLDPHSDLRAVGSADRYHRQLRLLASLGELWRYDNVTGANEPDDDSMSLLPGDLVQANNGRWRQVSSVPNIQFVATLRSSKAITQRRAHVLHYSAVGDRGGGDFYFDGASTEADDGGTIFQPGFATGSPLATGRWKREYSGAFNVRWFGAGNGNATQDTAAINSILAITSSLVGTRSSTIYFPWVATGYSFTSAIIVQGGGSCSVSLEGEAAGSTQPLGVRLAYVGVAPIAGGFIEFRGGAGMRVKNLTIHGGNNSKYALWFQSDEVNGVGLSDAHVSDVTLFGCRNTADAALLAVGPETIISANGQTDSLHFERVYGLGLGKLTALHAGFKTNQAGNTKDFTFVRCSFLYCAYGYDLLAGGGPTRIYGGQTSSCKTAYRVGGNCNLTVSGAYDEASSNVLDDVSSGLNSGSVIFDHCQFLLDPVQANSNGDYHVAFRFNGGHLDIIGTDVEYGALVATTASFATPIVVGHTAHLLRTGDRLQIYGALGNTAANGYWRVIVTDVDHFSLQDPVTGANSVGNGSYTGSSAHYGIMPKICIDPANGAYIRGSAFWATTGHPSVVNVTNQDLLDRTVVQSLGNVNVQAIANTGTEAQFFNAVRLDNFDTATQHLLQATTGVLKLNASGTLLGVAPLTVTGSRGSGAAFTDLLAKLSTMGIVVDSSSP